MRLSVILLLTAGLAGCFGSAPACLLPDGTTGDGPPHAVLHTDWGDLVVRLFDDAAPIAVENFLQLADNGTYDNTLFWRMENEFMMQGGDPTNEGDGGWSSTGEPIPDEVTPDLSHDKRGILSMANRGPNTARSQFFVTFSPAPSLDVLIDGNIHKGHTIFGEVVDGMDILAGLNYYAAGPNQGGDRGVPYHNATVERLTLGCGDLTPIARTNVLTPGVWDVRNQLETIAAWARHAPGENVEWDLTNLDGTPLPDGWQFSAAPLETLELPDGWTMALLSLGVPDDAVSGFEHVLLRAGDAVQPIQLRVATEFERVAHPGDELSFSYGMREATSTVEVQIQQPTIELRVGTPSTVPGFAWGLAGLADDERAVLHLPAGIAYGYEIPAGDRLESFNGIDIDYTIQVRDLRPLGS